MSLSFRVSIETDDATGDVLAVYFQVRRGKSHETREFERGKVFADYNRRGELLGIEMLAPCKVSVVDKLAKHEPDQFRRRTKQFMKRSGPRRMVPA